MSPDSPLYRGLTTATDVVIVNLLTLLGCVPIVTAGASLTAGARVTMEIVRDEDSYIARTWWTSFKGNLKQSFGWWLPMLLLLVAGVAEYVVMGFTHSPVLAGALSGVLIVGLALVLCMLFWILPLVAFFNNTVTGHVGNAILLAGGHLLRTIACLAVAAIPVVAFILLPGARTILAWFAVIIGVGFTLYMHALIQRRVIDDLRAAAAG